MIQLMEKLQQRINTDEREVFQEEYYGKFFTGDMTLLFGKESFTLSFHRGAAVAIQEGVPNTGIDIGISGDDTAWNTFRKHKSLSISTNKGNMHNLQIIGSPLRARQNFNPMAYLIRVWANLMEEENI